MLELDKKYFLKYDVIAGIDEVGRGPLAGPVVASAVIFDKKTYIDGVNDSKKISKKKRDIFYDQIKLKALYIGIGMIHPKEIDAINILNATKKAMKLAIQNLGIVPEILLVDGNQIEFSEYKQENIIKGDSKSFSIASASIIAKVTRDRMMEEYAKILPEYGFESHKGYGTEKHIKAIIENKASIIHRKSFNPVHKYLPSFSYYIENEMSNRLLIQIGGDYLIKNHHSILFVNQLSIETKFQEKYYLFYIQSNLKIEQMDMKPCNEKLLNRILSIIFKDGSFNININSI